MAITLVYSDCSAHAAGDYSAAAEVAYALESYYYTIGEDSHCILASSEEGVKVLENLYGSPNGIEVHGKRFDVVNLSDFANDDKKKDVTQFVEVAYCNPAPIDLLAKIVDPLSTKILMVALPHYKIDDYESILKRRFPQSCANGLAHTVAEGFGKDRIGVLVYQGPFESLNHADYCGITKYPYGFSYYKGGLGHSKQTLVDYLKVSTSLNNAYNNFVFVGDCNLNLEAIKESVALTKKPAEVCDLSTGTIYKITPHNINGFDIQQTPLPKDYEMDGRDQNCIHACLLPKVKNTQMRSLLKSSQPFVTAEGVNTVIEALAFGKIPLIQYMDNNKDLYPFYRKALLENCPSDRAFTLARLFDLCLRNRQLDAAEAEELRILLNNEKITKTFIQTNLSLINNGANPAKQMAEELQKPGAIDKNYHGPAFGNDLNDLFSLLNNPFLLALLSATSRPTMKDILLPPSPPLPKKSALDQFSLFNNKNSSRSSKKPYIYMPTASALFPSDLFNPASKLSSKPSRPNPLEAHINSFRPYSYLKPGSRK